MNLLTLRQVTKDRDRTTPTPVKRTIFMAPALPGGPLLGRQGMIDDLKQGLEGGNSRMASVVW